MAIDLNEPSFGIKAYTLIVFSSLVDVVVPLCSSPSESVARVAKIVSIGQD